jgi:hypothetical protein
MIVELLLRCLIGGVIVCAFSAVSEVIKPQSYAGIFGAAPSVALATRPVSTPWVQPWVLSAFWPSRCLSGSSRRAFPPGW